MFHMKSENKVPTGNAEDPQLEFPVPPEMAEAIRLRDEVTGKLREWVAVWRERSMDPAKVKLEFQPVDEEGPFVWRLTIEGRCIAKFEARFDEENVEAHMEADWPRDVCAVTY